MATADSQNTVVPFCGRHQWPVGSFPQGREGSEEMMYELRLLGASRIGIGGFKAWRRLDINTVHRHCKDAVL